MRLIEKIAGIFDALPLKKMTIEEWGDEVIYYKPLTGEEYDTALKELEPNASGPRNNTQTVILKALDQNGVRLFSNDDAETLNQKAFVATTSKIANAMTHVISPEAAAKD